MGFLSRITGYACLSVLLLAAPAAAATIHVSAANTSGIEDGSAAHPFNTVAEGILAARPAFSWDAADEVLVQPGYYSGYIYLRDFVKVRGTNPKTVLLSGIISGPFGFGTPHLWLEGLTVTGTGGIQAWNRGRLTDPSTWEIREVLFRGVDTPIYARGAVNLNLTRCLMHNFDSAIHMFYTSGLTDILHCTLDLGTCNNEGVGIHLPTPENRVFLTNTIISNTRFPVVTWDQVWHTYTTGSYGWQVTADHCDFYQGTVPADMAKVDCLTQNPLYLGWYGGASIWDQRRLSPLSPCIDAGTPVGMAFAGSAPDIGAVEFTGVTPPPDLPPEPPDPPQPTLEELVATLATSFSELDQASLKSASEQRRDAFCNKMDAIINQLARIDLDLTTDRAKLAAYRDLRKKLVGDLLAKCDGSSGGDPGNDWIDDAADSALFSKLITDTILLVDAEITRLGG